MKTVRQLQKENTDLKAQLEILANRFSNERVLFMHLTLVNGVELSEPERNPYKSKADIEFNGGENSEDFISAIEPYERILTIHTDNGDLVFNLHAKDEDALKVAVSSANIEV